MRFRGYRYYKVISYHKGKLAAAKAMITEFARDTRIKRGDVLHVVRGSYYDPDYLFETKR